MPYVVDRRRTPGGDTRYRPASGKDYRFQKHHKQLLGSDLELRKDFDNISKILQEKFNNIIEKIKIQHEQTKHLSDKELGLYLKSRKGDIEERIRNTVFLVRKKDLLTEVYVGGSKMRKTVFKMFKPVGNVLENFVPSSAMNRFDTEG